MRGDQIAHLCYGDIYTMHQFRLRTINGLEQINLELRRRTRVVSIFPNPDSCLRLVSALLAELDDEWMIGYLNLNPSTMITDTKKRGCTV